MNIEYIKQVAIECIENNRIESDFLEYKKSGEQKDKILKTMCAFANNIMNRKLNLILLGVEEHSEKELKATPIRPIKGFNESEIEGVQKSINTLIPCIKPNIKFDLTHAFVDGRAFIIIAVYNNNNGPYEVSDKGEKLLNVKRGRYIRNERETRLPNVFEEFSLLKKFANYHFTEEFSTVANLDDLDVDYIREYLALTSNRNNTNILSKHDMAQNMNLIDSSTNFVKNYSILMFCRNPEKFIPYSFVELIHRSSIGESIMQSKEYRGPIWKQLKNVMDDIKNTYIKSVTLRVKDELESETIYNYPYSTVEELVTNAIVHKNYENPRTVQIYIYSDSIVITNYNKPIPPITIKDLNELDAFPNRSYENPSIREMFKALDYIESYGSGIGKAKRAMTKNGEENIHFDEYDDNIDITSVRIPINKKFVKYLNLSLESSSSDDQSPKLDIQSPKLDIGDEELDIQSPKLDIGNEKLDIQSPKLDIGDEKLDIQSPKLDIDDLSIDEKITIKVNTIDILDIVNKSLYSSAVKKIILKIYNKFFNDVFSRSDIIKNFDMSKSNAANYIDYLLKLNIIELVRGLGKGKYKFK